MKEEWKDIPGFEGIYQISSHGRLKSFKEIKDGRILSNTNKDGGYFSVVLLAKYRENRYVRMHRLVAEAFIPNPGKLPEVNHKDCNKQNNYAGNLEWVTRKQNSCHAVKNKPEFLNGMRRYNQRIRPNPIIQFSLDGKYIKTHINGTEAAKATGVCQRNILQVASGTEYKPGMKRIQAGGFNWYFMLMIDMEMDHSDVNKNDREFLERKRLCLELSKRKSSRRSRNESKDRPARP